jgi:hypothetical protein
MQAIAFGGRSFHANLKWAWKGNRPELLVPIAFNQNGQLSNRNLITMIDAINAQLPK